MWICGQVHCFSVLLLLAASASSTDIERNKSPSNWAIDGSNKINPLTSDVDIQRNRYPFVGEQWSLSKIDGQSFSLDLQLNNSISSNQSSIATAEVNTVWSYFSTGCTWLPINHISFQLAHVFLCLSYVVPAGLYGLIYLRVVLAIGSALLAAWACFIICAFDTFVWNSLFLLVNALHATVLIVSLRTVRFGPQMQQVYADIFQPLKVSKRQFKTVVKCITSIRLMKRTEYFSIERETKVESLCLLLSGSMSVSENGRMLHLLRPLQFLDSSDWFQLSSDSVFQVSIRACEESRVLIWHRDKLRVVLQKDAFLQSAFHEILGRDVVRKYCQMRENIASSSESSLFKRNLVNNVMFVESEKALSTCAVLNSKYANKVDKSSRNLQKLLQMKQKLTNSQCTTSNPMNTL